VNEKPIFSLVVPTYNEAENVVAFLDSAHAALAPFAHEILIVDDNSPDLTWQIAETYAQTHPGTRILRRLHEKGLGSAVLYGFAAAEGSILGVMDADLQHDEKILPRLIAGIQSGADIAIGSRHAKGGGIPNWPWYRRLASFMAKTLARLVVGVYTSDPMSGYFVLRRSLYEQCAHSLKPQGYKILLEILCRTTPKRIVESPYVFRERQKGESKLSGMVIRDYLSMLITLLRERQHPSA